ncbi:interleukin-17C [Rhinoraja longicauda]
MTMWTVQLLLVILCLRGGAARRRRRAVTEQCFFPEDLQDQGEGMRKLLSRANTGRFPALDLVNELEQPQREPGPCPKLGLPSPGNADLGHRSISPWEYRIEYDADRYPTKLAFARCLCAGCIDVETGEETRALNSVVLEQSQLVLRRRPCPGQDGRYSFQLEYIMVPVGCTCVLPRSRS